ncbi:phosphoribosyltransferase [uncultured Clostridium sp.]|uniref:phosphoribosyltransferase n=2 Tax=uncultured Clostridium sp. TaxID=59620 RepID=UPI00262FCE8B|nr:phosphoribosyltransferase [uncultured Clostridium sp.]
MEKILVISKEVYRDYCNYDCKGEFKLFMDNMLMKKNAIVFITRDLKDVDNIKKYFYNLGYNNTNGLYVFTRDGIKELIKLKGGNNFIVIGNRDKDFELAVNNKLLYIVPNWCNDVYFKSKKYGVNINKIEELEQIIKTTNNQNNWYYKDTLRDGTKIYSLMSGMYRKWDVTPEEKELVIGFEKFLKYGEKDYYEILYYHFLAAISNLEEFKEIDIWGIAPSSGLKLNKDMLQFKDKARYMMKKKLTRENENLFLRHTQIPKSHSLNSLVREESGAARNLQSIYLNPDYNVRGKNVCIFDDYLTYGNTFEAMRNILRKAGANKIIFVSLGRFRRNYIYQDFKINGDVTIPNGFTYELKSREYREYHCNENARKEVKNLHDIFNLEL